MVSDEKKVPTFCIYCHSTNLNHLESQKSYKPENIISFKIDKKQAIKIFQNWAKDIYFLPDEFVSMQHIEKISKFYLQAFPSGINRIDALGKSNQNNNDNTLNKETSNISNIFTGDIVKILEGYDYNEIKSFEDTDLIECFTEVYEDKDAIFYKVESDEKHLIYLPIWFLNYKYDNEYYSFVINGQTGKFIGEYPIDNIKRKKYLSSKLKVLFIIFLIIATLGGVLI